MRKRVLKGKKHRTVWNDIEKYRKVRKWGFSKLTAVTVDRFESSSIVIMSLKYANKSTDLVVHTAQRRSSLKIMVFTCTDVAVSPLLLQYLLKIAIRLLHPQFCRFVMNVLVQLPIIATKSRLKTEAVAQRQQRQCTTIEKTTLRCCIVEAVCWCSANFLLFYCINSWCKLHL